MKTLAIAAALAAFAVTPALAADCTTDIAKDDLTVEQANGLYDCIKEDLRAGYASQDAPFSSDYQSWKAASTAPMPNAGHGNRFLMTFVNETGYDEYVTYSDERGPMPVGSILAKESFNVSKKGAVQKGPLFFMEKVAAGGDAEEYGNWVYSAVQPKGKPMAIKQAFCHACHAAFEDQDAMGYPDEDVWVKAE